MIKHKMSFKKVIIRTLVQALVIILFLFAFLFNDDPEMDVKSKEVKYIIASVGLALILFVLLINYLIYRSEYYYLLETSINYEMTFIIKKQVILPYNKINVVNLKRGIFDRIFGTSSVKVGSGNSSTASREEMTLILDKEFAKEFVSKLERIIEKAKNNQTVDLENLTTDNTEEKETNKPSLITTGDFFKKSFFTEMTLLMVLFIAIIMIPIGIANEMVFIIPVGIVIGYCFVGLVTFITYYLLYGNATIERKNDNIRIKYGVLVLKNYVIPISKIHGVVYGHTLLGKQLGLGSLMLSVVGLTSETNQNNGVPMLTRVLPVGKLDLIESIVEEYIPEFKLQDEVLSQKPSTKSFKHYYTIPLIIFTLALLPAIMFTFIIIIPTAIISLFMSYLNYKYSSISVNDNISRFTFGSIYRKEVVCKTKSILEINKIAGCIRLKENIATVKLNLRGYPGKIYIRNIHDFNLSNYN